MILQQFVWKMNMRH